MNTFRMVVLVCYGLALMAASACGIADAPLLNLDSPQRISGEYYVEFKPVVELAKVPSEGAGAPRVLPGVHPVSKASLDELAKALAMSANAELVKIVPGRRRCGFIIRRIEDRNLRELAKDPRIAFIEAALRIKSVN